MKNVSLKTQKIVAFIPYVNLCGWFLCLYNLIYFNASLKTKSQAIFIVFAVALPIAFLTFLMRVVWPDLEQLSSILQIYFVPLGIDLGLIWFQEKEGLDI